MSGIETRLGSDEIKRFLVGRTTYAFDPTSRERVATVTYRQNGTCSFQFETGGGDNGQWGIEADTYWTRYAAFRNGARHNFYLNWIGTDVAQAYHEDGMPAFVQSGLRELDEAGDGHT